MLFKVKEHEMTICSVLTSFLLFSVVKNWMFFNFTFFLQTMMHLKEKKDMDDNFKKAQKPWAKLLQKVNKAKADYHNACKAERTAVNQERNASGDSAFSTDQVRKFIVNI